MDENFFEVESPTPILPKQQVGDLPLSDQELAGPRLPKHRKHWIHISLVLVALVVVAVLFQSISSLSSPVLSVPTSAPLPPPIVLITSNINFGTVAINSQQQDGTMPMFFMPHDGSYKITINAAPFQPKTCTFTFSGSKPQTANSKDCLIISGNFQAITANGTSATPSFAVEIDFTAADLPPDQQSQINTLLAHSITAQQTTTVPPGSYIATSLNADNTITSQRSTTTLQAAALLIASTNTRLLSFPCSGLICQAGVTPEGIFASPLTGKVWIIAVPVASRWRFATPTGHIVGDVSFPATDTLQTLLTYTSKDGWSLSPQSSFNASSTENMIGNQDCETGMQELQRQLQTMNFSLNSPIAPKGIEGCQITVQTNDNTNQGSFLWRFGVLLAADTLAHKLLPKLPIAPQAEIAAVRT